MESKELKFKLTDASVNGVSIGIELSANIVEDVAISKWLKRLGSECCY